MKSKHPDHIIVFRVLTNDADIMPPLTSHMTSDLTPEFTSNGNLQFGFQIERRFNVFIDEN